MEPFILHPNAAPIYGFLSLINSRNPHRDAGEPKKILDCGAGGPVPPLALFHTLGFETYGIDISPEELERANQYCSKYGIDLDLRPGDMRQIPFASENFDYVYEHCSMCHLSREDTALAVAEMYRVLKPGGLCFLGVISTDTWPRSLFGEERAPGEFYGEEGGSTNVLHSMFDDSRADALVSVWEVLVKEKHVRYLPDAAAEISLAAWMDLLKEAEGRFTPEAWKEQYAVRAGFFRYSHSYYILKKPE